MIDSTTAVQYSGYTQKQVRQMSEQGKIPFEIEEMLVRRRLEQERKRTATIVGVEKKVIHSNEPRGYDSQGKLTRLYELGEMGTKINLML